MSKRIPILAACLAAALSACATSPTMRGPVTWAEIEALPRPGADARITYGDAPQHFGELRLPQGAGPHPVVVLIHGGCWRAAFDLRHVAAAAAALTAEGFATWTIEYRRIGDEGGGWPGTLRDAGRATDHVRTLAERFPLDTARVVLMGHSAGGHLALWAAARPNLPAGSELRDAAPLAVRGVVPLAGIADLATYAQGAGSCNAAVAELMGGTPAERAERYAQADPSRLLPLRTPVRLVHGAADPTVPLEQSRAFEARARAAGDDARLVAVPGAGHFDVIAPGTAAWREVVRAARELAGR